MRTKDLAILVLLAAVWGLSYLFIRVAVPSLGPVGVAFARVVVGAAGLIGWALISRRRGELVPMNRRFIMLGVFNGAIPYGMIAFAELHLTASLAAVLNATTPLFTVMVAAGWAGQRLSGRVIGGMLLGFAGVAVLVGYTPTAAGEWLWLAAAAMLVASLSYGFASVYAKQRLGGVSPLGAATGQQLGSAIVLAPVILVAAATGNGPGGVSGDIVPAVLGLGLLCTSFAYLLYFYLIAHAGAVNTASVTFLIPVFGVGWSALFLGEVVQPVMLLGLLMILASVALVTRGPAPSPDPSAPVPTVDKATAGSTVRHGETRAG